MRASRPGMVLVASVLAAGALLVGAYVALGGGDYRPAAVADPCAPREWRDPQGTQRVVEQIALSTLDGAACDLGVSREELTLALASDAKFREFQAEKGLDDARTEAALRGGLLRAVDDADQAGALNGVEEFLLRQAAERVPLTQLIALVRDGRLDWVPGLFS